MITASFKCVFVAMAIAISPVAAATDLPSYIVQGIQQMGARIAADGTITMGTLRLVPFLPPQYNPATAPAGATLADCFIHQDKVSYVCPGNLQFAFLQNAAGELPHFSTGFMPMSGFMLPLDFVAPAGFVPPAGVALPTGFTIPRLTPAEMINQMVSAGLLPKGAVTFNADGTVSVNLNGVSTAYMPWRLPVTTQQGRYMPGMGYGISFGNGGTITFPDGTIYGPGWYGMMGGMMGWR
ncbi:MAG: hypothetical protein WCV99_11195 [Sterolibacterium sp.]|jgi:hypothetical protein